MSSKDPAYPQVGSFGATAVASTSVSTSSGSRVPSPWSGRRLSSSASNSPALSTPSGSASIAPSPHLRAQNNAALPALPSIAAPGDLSRVSNSALSSSSPRSFSPIHPEPDKRGNLEYKLRILPVSAGRFSRLVTQLKWRLAEGNGLAVYEIGVLDDGTLIGLPKEEMKNSLTQLAMMGRALGATCEIRRCIVVQRSEPSGADANIQAADVTLPADTDAIGGLEALDEATATPRFNTFRHRKAFSSKTQSAGLDNIVGLTSLTNDEAAKLLGTVPGSSAWSVDIATSDEEAEDDLLERNPDGDVDDDGSSSTASSDSAPDDNDDLPDDEGFAFSLNLDDGEDDQLTPAPPPRRPSRPVISNSPWKLATPEHSPSASHPQSPAISTEGFRNGTTTKGPTSLRAVQSASATVDAEEEEEDGHHFSDLAGMDVKGVLQFALDPGAPPSSINAKKKRKSGRRKREERQHQMALRISSGLPPSGEASAEQQADTQLLPQDPLAPIQATGFSPDEVIQLNQTKPRKPGKAGKRFSREPRVERRSRRTAELKAQEREGEGLLIALEADPALSDQDRAQWWKYSGLTFEDNLPHWDSTRQGWVREVADYLTVREMLELAESWDPRRHPKEEEEAESSMPQDGEQTAISVESAQPASPASPVDAFPATSRKSGQTIQQFLDASSSVNGDGPASSPLSRKANCRRRRKERKRQEADEAAHEQAFGHRRLEGRSPRPEFLPPPSNGVAIPSASGNQRSSTGTHPLSSSQIANDEGASDEDDDDDEEDNFSMGLTMNIDELSAEEGGAFARANRDQSGKGSAGGSSSHLGSLSPLSASSTSTAATTRAPAASLTATASGGYTDRQAQTTTSSERQDLFSDANVRIIVEAVLSLDTVQSGLRQETIVAGSEEKTASHRDADDSVNIEDRATVNSEDEDEDEGDFGVWEL